MHLYLRPDVILKQLDNVKILLAYPSNQHLDLYSDMKIFRILLMILPLHLLSSFHVDGKEINIQLIPSCNNHPEQLTSKDLFMYKNTVSSVSKKICLRYLKKYEEKDIKGIEEMFSEDIVLRDWKIRVEGKEKALIETLKKFQSVVSIKIDVLSIYENESTVAAELKIVIDNKAELYVIDVITINPEGKISSIKAFIGRGDK